VKSVLIGSVYYVPVTVIVFLIGTTLIAVAYTNV